MKDVILSVKTDHEFIFETIDIESDIKLFEKYKKSIPVLTINGKLFAKYRVEEDKLRRKLTEMNY